MGSAGASFVSVISLRESVLGSLFSEKFGFQDCGNLQNAPKVVSYLHSKKLVVCPLQNDIANSSQRSDRLFMRGVGIGKF